MATNCDLVEAPSSLHTHGSHVDIARVVQRECCQFAGGVQLQGPILLDCAASNCKRCVPFDGAVSETKYTERFRIFSCYERILISWEKDPADVEPDTLCLNHRPPGFLFLLTFNVPPRFLQGTASTSGRKHRGEGHYILHTHVTTFIQNTAN
jgi:hypothetical protein